MMMFFFSMEMVTIFLCRWLPSIIMLMTMRINNMVKNEYDDDEKYEYAEKYDDVDEMTMVSLFVQLSLHLAEDGLQCQASNRPTE